MLQKVSGILNIFKLFMVKRHRNRTDKTTAALIGRGFSELMPALLRITIDIVDTGKDRHQVGKK